MANKPNKDAFNRLKKMTPRQRQELAQTPDGRSLLGLLTPTQFAELFPKYYERGLPDVSGFRAAISKKSQEAQQRYFDAIDEKLGTASPEGTRGGRTPGGGPGGGTGGGGKGNVAGSFKATQYAAELRKAGFKEEDIVVMTAVGMRESNGNVSAHNDSNPGRERSYGLFQVNINAHPFDSPEMKYAGVKSVEDLYDPEKNAKVAYYLYYKTPTGIRHWGGYTDGGYKQYMGTAQAAAAGREVGDTTPSGSTGGGTGETAGGIKNFVGRDDFRNAKGHTECALYAELGGGVPHSSNWKPGAAASSGNLKPGDWLARFDPDGTYGNRHGYSHVVRFEGYIRDKNGKIIGTNVTHQHNGTGKVVGDQFFFGSGRSNGEFDPANFHQIADRKTGKPYTMAPADGNEQKVQERTEHYEKNPASADGQQTTGGQTAKVTAAAAVTPPLPHPAGAAGEQTADLTSTFNISKASFLKNIHDNHMFVPFSDESLLEQTRDGFKKAGVPFTETGDSIKVKISPKDPRYLDAIKEMKDNSLQPDKFITEEKKRASLGEKIQQEFGVASAQAKELDLSDPATRAAIMEQHRKGGAPNIIPDLPEKTAKVDAVKMRQKIESYYGKPINDHEYDMLLRATHGESSAKRHVPEEHAMIMGTILNRAKSHKGGIEGALMARYQFESVTGRTKGRFAPNPAYKAGPSERRMQSIYDGVMGHLHNVSEKQKYFTSEGIKNKWRDKMIRTMDTQVIAGTRFGTKLGTGAPPETTAVAQVQPPAPTPQAQAPQVQESTLTERLKKEISPVTPAYAGEAPKTPPATEPKREVKAPEPVKAATPEFPKNKTTETPTPPTRPTAIVAPPAPVKAPDESSTKNFLRSQGIPGASDGGSFDVPRGNISFYPLDKKDDMAAVDTATQRPLFTAKTGEQIGVGQGRVDVTPSQRVNGNSVGSAGDGLDSVRHAMVAAFAGAGQDAGANQRQPIQSTRPYDNNFVENLTQQNKQPWNNPAFERAMHRTRGFESGDPLNNHFSSNNTNA
jgi:hypothetical protein